MRRLLLCSTLAGAVAASSTAMSQRPEPQPTFRAQVDVMTIDVTVFDRNGVPVEDLRPDDFIVRVGKETRRVFSAELNTVNRPERSTAVPVAPRFFSTNATPVTSRKVMFAVDQMQIAPGTLAPLIQSAHQFLDALLPYDQAAMVAFPPPGPQVQFTTDKERVRVALRMELGNRATRPSGIPITLYEALRISDREMSTAPGVAGPETARVLERMRCDQDPRPECSPALIKNEATVVAQTARTEGRVAVAELESLLDRLALIDGPKTLVLLSAGMFAEDANAMREAVRRAALARTTIHVVTLEPGLAAGDGGDQGPPASTLQDRQLQLGGLQEAAAGTGGSLYRPGGNGAAVFKRIASEISASYVLSVEAKPDDGRRDRVAVEVKRRGLSVRASTALAAPVAKAPPSIDQSLSNVLSSPVPVAGIPLRVTTFTGRDAATGKPRVTIAADIGQAGAPPAEFGVGYVLTAPDGTIVGRGGVIQTLTATTQEPARYDGTIVVDPGAYTLRFGIVDREGRRGSVVRELQVGALEAAPIEISDLFVGSLSAAAAIRPAVEPRIRAGEVALYVEVYPRAERGEMTVSFEIGEGEESPPLATAPANVSDGATAPWRVARGAIQTPLAPGRYVARAKVRVGETTVITVARPFVLEPNPARPADTPVMSSAGHAELSRRTAAYVSQFVLGMANVVAQEDFDLGRQVRSDFLLVRRPGTDLDLMLYRDVYQVGGKALPGREERLAGLFVRPADSIHERIREIITDGAEHVPPALNPLYALMFLQGVYQPRFTFTVADAEAPWPDGVRMVSFEEVGRPTLLRWGALDVPSHGKAWIEEATGRVFRTELELGTNRGRPTITTTFKLDERLQVMVPDRMQTRNPEGTAVYTNFRRFTVSAATAIK